MIEKPSTTNESRSADADNQELPAKITKKNRSLEQIWENLVRVGLGEISLRVGAALVSIALILLVVWVMNTFYLKGKITNTAAAPAALTEVAVVPESEAVMPPLELHSASASAGISRLAMLRTILPTKPRYDIAKYEVQSGDTIFGIAEKFGLNPETILFGNYDVLADNPHSLTPGQELHILPTNGTLYTWNEGDGLNKVAEYFGVQPDVIVNWPGNHLDPATVGDYAFPTIPDGTVLFVPGGYRTFITWSAPRITRRDPAAAKLYGEGYCGVVTDGVIGDGIFAYPTDAHFLSGYDYSPATNHYGLDFDGELGSPIYAVDNGVVVYAGWNNYGYGNVIVIDHGNGWQSLYAHLEQLYVGCGASVFRGNTIGMMGSTGKSTGPHLHFELRTDHAYVNPWDYLR